MEKKIAFPTNDAGAIRRLGEKKINLYLLQLVQELTQNGSQL